MVPNAPIGVDYEIIIGEHLMEPKPSSISLSDPTSSQIIPEGLTISRLTTWSLKNAKKVLRVLVGILGVVGLAVQGIAQL